LPADPDRVRVVRWYLRYGLSYRDLEELLAERVVIVAGSIVIATLLHRAGDSILALAWTTVATVLVRLRRTLRLPTPASWLHPAT